MRSLVREPKAKARATATATAATVVALAGWVALVWVGRKWVLDLEVAGHRINFSDGAPFIGHLDWHPSLRVWVPIAVAVLTVVAGSHVAANLRWQTLLVVASAWSALWSVTVALVDVDGWHGLTRPLKPPEQYLAAVPQVGSLGEFLSSFNDRVLTVPLHVSSHPPGMVMVHWFMDRLGLGGTGWAAVLTIGVAASGVAAVLLAVRNVADEGLARRVAPFIAVAPTAIWIATTADAFFAGVVAWGVTCCVVATDRRQRRPDLLALVGGILFGAAAFLSYGLVLLALIPLTVAWARRTLRPLVLATIGGGIVLAGFALAGFWWFDGLEASRRFYDDGVASERPYRVFLVVNLSIFAAALGPGIAVALARLRDRRLWLLVGGALAVVAIATLSGYSKSEVERIWLPFAPWVLVACAALTRPLRSARLWLAVQAAYTIVLTTALRTPW